MTLDEISAAIIMIIRAGAVMRFIYCMVSMQFSEESAKYKKRTINTILFYIIAESIFQIRDIIIFYYK